jgi:hypothetical protein
MKEKEVWTTPELKKMDIEETAFGLSGTPDNADPGTALS